MKQWRKKGLLALLVLILLTSLLSACTKSEKESTVTTEVSPKKESSAPAETSKEPQYPAALTYWVGMDPEASATMKSYSEMGMYTQLEKITGTKAEFQHPPVGQEQDQFNLIMASGKLPDVIDAGWGAAHPDKAIADGKILRLNELIENYAPNLSKIIKNSPAIRKMITTDEGNIYVFPTLANDPKLTIYNGLIIRKDWLDKLGLQPPTTIDEWEKMLIAFRDGDPNGNSKKDEIPFLFNKDNIFFSHAFAGAYGITTEFFNDGGTIKYGPYEPKFKEFLTLMNKWYKDGLIDKDYLTVDANLKDSKVTNNQLGSFDGWVGGDIGKYTDLMKTKDPNFKFMGVQFPSLVKDGEVVATLQPGFGGYGAAISKSAKNPEQIAAWLDYGYSEKGNLLFNFGIEGESYTMVNGKPTFTDLIVKNPNSLPVSQALARYTRMGSNAPFEYSVDGYEQYNAMPEQREAKANWAKANHEKLMPQLSLTNDEQTKDASIMTDLITYRDEMINKFIMGAESLDKFDDYINTLKKLGIEDDIKIKQTAYDRYLKK